jgi:hypothetical protein
MNTLPARLMAIFLAFLAASAGFLRAQDVAERFPAIAQVNADYPDDAQRSAAFSVLSDALTRAEPRPVSKDAYNKIFDYQGTANAILSAHMANGAMQNGQYRAFNAQVDQCLDSTDFRRGVLQKYGVESATEHPQARPPGYTPPLPVTPAQTQYQQSQAQIQTKANQAAAALVKMLTPSHQTDQPPFEADADVFDQMPKLVLFSLLGLPSMALASTSANRTEARTRGPFSTARSIPVPATSSASCAVR